MLLSRKILENHQWGYGLSQLHRSPAISLPGALPPPPSQEAGGKSKNALIFHLLLYRIMLFTKFIVLLEKRR
jgi:hypothetical protein